MKIRSQRHWKGSYNYISYVQEAREKIDMSVKQGKYKKEI